MAERNTVQKKIVFDQLQLMHNHPTVDEVYHEVQQQLPSISKATVYRTLNKLAEMGKITRVPVSNGADRFDYRCDPHYHVICSICGRVDDVDLPELPSHMGQEEAASLTGYVISRYEIQYAGVCPHCLRLAEKEVI